MESRNLKESKVLRLFAKVNLIIGLLVGVLLLFFVDWGDIIDWEWDLKYNLNIVMFPCFFIFIIASITIWAFLNVVANISESLTKMSRNQE